MKKLFSSLILFTLLFSATMTTIYAAYTSGNQWFKGDTLKGTYYTGNNYRGDYMYTSLEGYGYMKKVRARMGDTESYSNWVGSREPKASVTDYGPWGSAGAWNYGWDFYYQ